MILVEAASFSISISLARNAPLFIFISLAIEDVALRVQYICLVPLRSILLRASLLHALDLLLDVLDFVLDEVWHLE